MLTIYFSLKLFFYISEIYRLLIKFKLFLLKEYNKLYSKHILLISSVGFKRRTSNSVYNNQASALTSLIELFSVILYGIPFTCYKNYQLANVYSFVWFGQKSFNFLHINLVFYLCVIYGKFAWTQTYITSQKNLQHYQNASSY